MGCVVDRTTETIKTLVPQCVGNKKHLRKGERTTFSRKHVLEFIEYENR
ncbi:hypothetical protein Leryth_019987 [Lithospermum erythrorhizon]|nr:hypothetical protein Leryth_019987 [Lithospermum erythrorhizon]